MKVKNIVLPRFLRRSILRDAAVEHYVSGNLNGQNTLGTVVLNNNYEVIRGSCITRGSFVYEAAVSRW